MEGFENPGTVVLIATGGMIPTMISVGDELQKQGVKNISLINANWLQPYDASLLGRISESSAKLVVTMEDHYKSGGLGGIVAEYFSSLNQSPPLLRVGVNGFGQSGSPSDNLKAYGLDTDGVTKQVLARLQTTN